MIKRILSTITMMSLTATLACSDIDQNGPIAAAAAKQACSQSQQQMDTKLEEILLNNSCLKGYEVDATAHTCAAAAGQTASWVCTECKQPDTPKVCSNSVEFSFKVNLTVTVATITASGSFSGKASGSFKSVHSNSSLAAIADARGTQPAFSYYRSTAKAKVKQDKGFSGTFEISTALPPGVNKSLSINSELSCNNKVEKELAQKSTVAADTCGEQPTCTGPTTGGPECKPVDPEPGQTGNDQENVEPGNTMPDGV